jgi:hypothetical protein
MGRNRSTSSAITKAQTIVLIAALMLSALLLAYTAASHGNARAIEEKGEGIVEIPLHNTLVITVQRTTGEAETYVKQGDPWTQNLIALIANHMLGRGYSSPLNIYKTDGSIFNYIETAYYGPSGSSTPDPMLAIQIGQSDYALSPMQYALIQPIATFDVPSSGVSVSDDGVAITATFTSSWTASSDVTVREVGLILKVCTYGTATYSTVLLARDVLSTPVSLGSGDVISVSYQVSFTYSQPPFLKNFAAVLFNYIFGLKYYGQARIITAADGSSVSIDYGYDTGTPSASDYIKEPSSLIYDGADIASYAPSKATIGTIAIRVDNVMVNVQVVNSTHAKISYIGSTSSSSPVTVSAVGLSFKTDTDTGYQNNYKDILILYFPFDNPLKVPAGSSVKFTFTIWLRLVPS